jgi:hypothetical protein
MAVVLFCPLQSLIGSSFFFLKRRLKLCEKNSEVYFLTAQSINCVVQDDCVHGVDDLSCDQNGMCRRR